MGRPQVRTVQVRFSVLVSGLGHSPLGVPEHRCGPELRCTMGLRCLRNECPLKPKSFIGFGAWTMDVAHACKFRFFGDCLGPQPHQFRVSMGVYFADTEAPSCNGVRARSGAPAPKPANGGPGLKQVPRT